MNRGPLAALREAKNDLRFVAAQILEAGVDERARAVRSGLVRPVLFRLSLVAIGLGIGLGGENGQIDESPKMASLRREELGVKCTHLTIARFFEGRREHFEALARPRFDESTDQEAIGEGGELGRGRGSEDAILRRRDR